MANVGQFDKQKMHAQLIGKANFRELTYREDVLRNRQINVSLGVFGGILTTFTILYLRFVGFGELIVWTGVIGGILIFALLVRLGFVRPKRRDKKRENKGKDWERIRSLPDWARKKMRKRHINKVNGENYIYLKKGNKFYKRKK